MIGITDKLDGIITAFEAFSIIDGFCTICVLIMLVQIIVFTIWDQILHFKRKKLVKEFKSSLTKEQNELINQYDKIRK